MTSHPPASKGRNQRQCPGGHQADAAKPQGLKGREDLRDLPLITIDPSDARDHDDACYAHADEDPKNEGGHVLWVAIALTWGTVATAVIIILPVYESWAEISTTLQGMFTNDDVHMRMDIIDSKLDSLLKAGNLGESGNKLTKTDAYRAKLLAGKL